jgi:hypothetical protein
MDKGILFSHLKKNQILSFAATWAELEIKMIKCHKLDIERHDLTYGQNPKELISWKLRVEWWLPESGDSGWKLEKG